MSNQMHFPQDFFAECAARHIASCDGALGIAALAERVRSHWDNLNAAWNSRHGIDGASLLGAKLVQAAKACDRSDLIGRDIPLRATSGGDLQGSSDAGVDINVCAKLIRAMIEVLSDNNNSEAFDAIVSIASSSPAPGLYDDAFFARLVAIDLHLERGDYDSAIAAAKTNLTFGCCPTSQFLLFKSLLAKKKSGAIISESEICLDDLSDRFCPEPFNTLSTGSAARRLGEPPFFACQCPGTLPYPVSNYERDIDRDSLWNGPEIQEIRRSILDGDFTYCSRMLCPALTGRTLPKRSEISDPRLRDIIDNHRTELITLPVTLTLGHDPSCNIACPSCRNEILVIKNEARERLDRLADDILLPLMENASLALIICTDGDPIGSKHYRRLIHGLDAKRHASVNLSLITNGLLLTPREWEAIKQKHSLISFVGVSIDGACKETYEDLRRPGKWETITANMDFLGRLRRDGQLPMLGLQFVVQKKNFEEMIEFVKLGKKWNADIIRFIRLTNIGSYTGGAFEENDVSDPRHPLYPRLMSMLRDPIFRDPSVSMFTLTPLWEAANAMRRRSLGERIADFGRKLYRRS